MQNYIMTIIGASLLAAMAGILSPEKWRGYIQIITGMVIISCIISPVLSLVHSDIFSGFDDSFEIRADNEDLQMNIVVSELEKRINEDIEARLKNEFNLSVEAECSVAADEDGNILGVEEIRTFGDTLTDDAEKRLREVYGITKAS